jgi:hypothetical protein
LALILIENIIYIFWRTSYLNEEVNGTEPYPYIVFPGISLECRPYLTGQCYCIVSFVPFSIILCQCFIDNMLARYGL